MKPQDDPDKATRALERSQRAKLFREKIKVMEFFYDWLDSGASIEELAIRLDIAAAGAGWSKSYYDVWRGGLEIIKKAHEQGADRNEVMTYLRKRQTRV